MQETIQESIKEKNGINVNNINFKAFEGKYVKLLVNEPKLLTLTNPKTTTVIYPTGPAEGVEFDVLMEDNEPCQKIFQTGSKPCVRALRPILEAAAEQNKESITVRIERKGEGVKTVYEVEEVSN